MIIIFIKQRSASYFSKFHRFLVVGVAVVDLRTFLPARSCRPRPHPPYIRSTDSCLKKKLYCAIVFFFYSYCFYIAIFIFLMLFFLVLSYCFYIVIDCCIICVILWQFCYIVTIYKPLRTYCSWLKSV